MASNAVTDARTGYHDLIRRDVVQGVPKKGGVLIDVGGGIGATASHLKQLGLADRAGVVDLVERPDGAPPLDFAYNGDLTDEKLLDRIIKEQGPFTTVLFLDILEHLVDPWALVKKFTAALTPDGVMIASIPNVRCLESLFPLVVKNDWTLRDEGILDRTHLRFFTRSSAIELMTSSGLTLQQVIPLPHMGRKYRLFRRATLGLSPSLTDRQYLVRVGAE